LRSQIFPRVMIAEPDLLGKDCMPKGIYREIAEPDLLEGDCTPKGIYREIEKPDLPEGDCTPKGIYRETAEPDLLEDERTPKCCSVCGAVLSEEEELEDLSPAEKELDPLKDAKIKRAIDGKEYNGYVEDIEVGKISGERLYRIKYADGDLQHMTEQQVKDMQIHENMLPVDGTCTLMSFLEDGLRIGKAIREYIERQHAAGNEALMWNAIEYAESFTR
jgi:hypothetical protein